MSAQINALVIPSTTRGRMHVAYVAALLLSEALLLIVVAKLIPKLIAGDDAEVLSVWAVAGTLALGFGIAHLLGSRALSGRQRVFWGLLITVIALQIIGRADLAESAAVWDMSWLIDLGRPSSDVWKRAGAIDEFFAALLLIPIWFRGVALGTADLDQRPFTRTAFAGFVVLLFGFTLGDNVGIESVVQIVALAWVMTCVIAVALKNSSNPATAEEGSGIQTGLSLAATLFALTRRDRDRAAGRGRDRRRDRRRRCRLAGAQWDRLRARTHHQGRRVRALAALLDLRADHHRLASR